MRLSRRKFVLLFLVFGFALHFATRFLLDQPPGAVGPTAGQAEWQHLASTILSPLTFVLFSPASALLQDPDPPPPFLLILFAAYWSVLAVGIHYLISKVRRRMIP